MWKCLSKPILFSVLYKFIVTAFLQATFRVVLWKPLSYLDVLDVQIVGTAQRDVIRKNSEGWGEGEGWDLRAKELSLSSYLFFPALWICAALHYLHAMNRLHLTVILLSNLNFYWIKVNPYELPCSYLDICCFSDRSRFVKCKPLAQFK